MPSVREMQGDPVAGLRFPLRLLAEALCARHVPGPTRGAGGERAYSSVLSSFPVSVTLSECDTWRWFPVLQAVSWDMEQSYMGRTLGCDAGLRSSDLDFLGLESETVSHWPPGPHCWFLFLLGKSVEEALGC